MDYLVDHKIAVPEATPARELEQRMTGERARVVELAAQGDALRVWNPSMEISLTALAEHPNDPALSTPRAS